MKKAKFMLAAIGVIAVVGGALAFKAHKNDKVSYYFCHTGIPTPTCQLTTISSAVNTTTLYDQNASPAQVTVSEAALPGGTNIAGQACDATNCETPVYYQPSTNQ